MKKPEPSETRFSYRNILFFLQFVRPVWKLGVSALLLSIIITALNSLLPLSSKILIDFIIMKKGFQKVEKLLEYLNLSPFIPSLRHFLESLNLVIAAMLFIGLSIAIFRVLQRYLTMRFQQELAFNLQTSLFDHLLSFPLSFFRKKQTGYLVSRVSDDIDASQFIFSQSISQLVTKLFFVFFGIVILFTLSIKLTIILIAVFPIYVFINYFFAGRIRSISRIKMEAGAQVSKNLQEVMSGVELIKSHTTEEREVAKVSGTIRNAIQTKIKSSILSFISQYSAEATQLLSIVLIMWFGAHEILNNSITIGDYVAFTTYMILLSRSVNTLSMFHIMLQPLFASMDRLMELFKIVPEIKLEEKHTLKKPDTVHGDIVFKNVSFSYEDGKSVLRNINFSVSTGEVIVLAGPSGAGKTTLINLILKFYLPQSGFIYLDGYELRDLDSKWLRQQIGIVSQDVFLFNDTIENNIRYGNIHATRKEVIDAARTAHIHEDIEQFADTYDTVIGERGIKLSAGQRQRISIARAFLKNPALLIFDEPTSALDEKTESILKDSMKTLFQGRTTFIISHRMSMIDIADRVFVLENGRIKEQGSRLSTILTS
jgi:subfamily B ATP-binding cassette protein MsbA